MLPRGKSYFLGLGPFLSGLILLILAVGCGSKVVDTTPTAPTVVMPHEIITALPDGQTDVPMVLVLEGEFNMGASPEQQAEVLGFGWSEEWLFRIRDLVESAAPVHTVYLDTFYIDKYEVTNAQYLAFVEATGHRPSAFWTDSRLNPQDQPVVGVSWHDAQAFCTWAGKRLPTEAEWEKAARGTEGLVYPWGDSWDASRLQSAEGVARRLLPTFDEWGLWRQTLTDASVFRPVVAGSFPTGASPYGALDMAGNVWEWTADWYGPDYYRQPAERNPKGPSSGADRVLRGGAFDVPRVIPFTWFRENFIPPEYRGSMVTGFRCASAPS